MVVRHEENRNTIPTAEPDINSAERKVAIGYRRVGKHDYDMIYDIIALLKDSPDKVDSMSGQKFPDPTYHWSVIVGDYIHHLQATGMGIMEDAYCWYANKTVDTAEWQTFDVGVTRFNDAAIASAGIQVINDMPEKYDIIDNNCQNFAVKLSDVICREGRKQVETLGSASRTLAMGFIAGLEAQALPTLPDQKQKVEMAYVKDGAAQLDFLEGVLNLMKDETPAVKVDDLANGTFEPDIKPQQLVGVAA